jgi:hypothetical protein
MDMFSRFQANKAKRYTAVDFDRAAADVPAKLGSIVAPVKTWSISSSLSHRRLRRCGGGRGNSYDGT